MLAAQLLFGAAWLALSVWTWRRLFPRGPEPLWARFVNSLVGFAVAICVASSVWRYVLALEGPFPASLVDPAALSELAVRLFIGFPIYIWTGYWLTRAVHALLRIPFPARP